MTHIVITFLNRYQIIYFLYSHLPSPLTVFISFFTSWYQNFLSFHLPFHFNPMLIMSGTAHNHTIVWLTARRPCNSEKNSQAGNKRPADSQTVRNTGWIIAFLRMLLWDIIVVMALAITACFPPVGTAFLQQLLCTAALESHVSCTLFKPRVSQ